MKYKIVVFLTGNIDPSGNVPSLKRNKASDRELDYFNSIKEWMKYKIPIVFCENSCFNSTQINRLFEKYDYDCEYLKFKTKVSHLGKGHGEAEIFHHAMKYSKILKESEFLVKCTGRYYVSNFDCYLEQVNTSMSEIIVNLSHNLSWADSRFFIFKNNFYHNHFFQHSNEVNEEKGLYFEHVLAKATHSRMALGQGWEMLVEYPFFIGIYGSGNKPYSQSFFNKMKFYLFHRLKRTFIKANV